MSSKITFGRLVGVILVVAALTSGTAYAAETSQGLKADGLRLDGIAQAYQQMQGIKADGQRLQGIADVYSRMQGLKADAARLQGIAQVYQQMQYRPAASFYTPQALKAEGLRWSAMARQYGNSQPIVQKVSTDNGFNWGDAGVGLAGGFAFSICAAALILIARRAKRTKIAL